MAELQYSRPRIAKEFGINEKTLSWLERTGRIHLEWTAVNGLMVTSLSEEAAKVLSCSKVAISALKPTVSGVILPFQRFLHLRFLQLPAEDLYQELIDRQLVSASVFSFDQLVEMRESFIEALPLLTQKVVRAQRAPDTEEEKAQFDIILDICEIHIAYSNPELEQSFQFMTNPIMKDCIDCALSTQSSFLEIQKFLLEVANFRISIEGLAFYQSLFHDISLVAPEVFTKYVKMLKPSLRDKMRLAINSTIDEFRMKSGFADEFDTEKVLLVFKDNLTENLINLLETKAPESEKAFHYTLRSLMMIIDRIDKGGGGGRSRTISLSKDTATDIYAPIRIEPQSMQKMGIFRLPTDTATNIASEGG